MGKEIVYCEICGDRILEQEFAKGRAVTVLNKNYCVKCKAEVAPDEEPAPESGRKSGHPSSSVRPPGRDGAARSQPRAATARPAAPPRAPTRPTARPAASKVPIFIGAGVGALALVALVVLILVNRKSPGDSAAVGKKTEQDKTARAERAWQDLQQEIEQAAKNDDADRVLAKIEAVRSDLAGSKYAAQLDGLKEEYQKRKKVGDLLDEARKFAEGDRDFTRFPDAIAKFDAAKAEAVRSATSRLPEIEKARKVYEEEYEKKAEEHYGQVRGQVLDYMSRRQWDNAMRVIDAQFPAKFRHSKVWKSTLERFYKECEAKKAGR